MKISDFITSIKNSYRAAIKKSANYQSPGQYRTIDINSETFEKIIRVVQNREVIDGVLPRGDEFIPLDVVGESFYQGDLTRLANGKPGSDCGWFAGLIIPEPRNEFDANAVAVYIIDPTLKPVEAFKVGYLPRELAAKTTRPITLKMLNDQEVVPILAKLTGGTGPSKPSYGVAAKIFWDFK